MNTTTTTAMTLGEASKATGKAKGTLSNAIKAGRLSAPKRSDGKGYAIEPAELYRVYPPVNDDVAGNNGLTTLQTEHGETHDTTSKMAAEINHLKDLVTRLDADKEELLEQVRHSRLLLTHQNEKSKNWLSRLFK